MMYDKVSIDDVIKYLFESGKDKHAQRVILLLGELKHLQGQLDIHYYYNSKDKTDVTYPITDNRLN